MFTRSEFVNYCLFFYGVDGIYEMSQPMTHSQAYHATAYREQSEHWLGGDTLDREHVLEFCAAVYGTYIN